SYTSDIQNHDFRFKLRSRIDPLALKTLFEGERPAVFDYFQLHEPPLVEGEIWGQWLAPEKFGAIVRVSATNFVFREAPLRELAAFVQFTNRYVTATDVMIRGGGPLVSASGVGYDLATRTVYRTKAFSTMDPRLITHAIGARTDHHLSPSALTKPTTPRQQGRAE